MTNLQAQTISTDRPTQAYGTATMPKGYFQIETGLGMDIYDGATVFSLGATQFRYGVAKNFELRMSTTVNILNDWYSQFDAWNSNIGMGLKGRIVEGDNVNFSYIAEASIPLSPSHVAVWNAFLLDHGVSEKVSFAYMLYYGYDFNNLANNFEDYGNAQFCYLINYQLLDKLSFFTEICASMNLIDPEGTTLLFDAGMTYLVKDNLQLDVFFGTGIRYTRGLFGAGVSWMPKKKKATPPVE
jgi:hypothetical protein